MTVEELKQKVDDLLNALSSNPDDVKQIKKDLTQAKKDLNAAIKAEKEEAKKIVEALMAPTKYFSSLYSDFASLQLNKDVDKIYFQSYMYKDKREVSVFYNKFKYCIAYVRLFDISNGFINWVSMKDCTVTVSIEDINILRNMKSNPTVSKAKIATSYVPENITITEDRFVINYGIYANDELKEKAKLEFVRGTKDCFNTARRFVKNGGKFIIEEENITDIIFANDVFKAYLNENKIQTEPTDNKALEIHTKDILVKLKEPKGSERKPKYTMTVSEPGESGIRYVMLMSRSDIGGIVQVMKTI